MEELKCGKFMLTKINIPNAPPSVSRKKRGCFILIEIRIKVVANKKNKSLGALNFFSCTSAMQIPIMNSML
jgi:hypothetical protein